jgi:hypothetical protein
MLAPLTDKADLRAAFNVLARQLKKRAKPLRRHVGWQGGGGHYTLYWRPDLQIWSLLDPKETKNRYWCCFGVGYPSDGQSQSITCEINPPIKGVDRRIAGIFLKDDNDSIYLAHSGKIGGGRKGIGKNSFLRYWRAENVESISWPDRKATNAIVIARLGGKRLPSQIARFVQKVEAFKTLAEKSPTAFRKSQTPSTYSPEFSGQRKSYSIKGRIESECDHGFVVEELVRELKRKKMKYANNRSCDLFVLAKNKRVRYLFEVKTDSSTSSIYQGIGQALYHTASYSPQPRPILVMPGAPKKSTAKALKRLGIRLVSYGWSGKRIRFSELDRAVRH